MTYLVADDLPSTPAGDRFRALLARPGILRMPGAHNGQAALQAKEAGFDALYLSGAAMTASMGIPDLGVITVDEVCFFVRQIARSTGLPLLVDGDTGYGEALNVMNMVRCFEDAGAVARAKLFMEAGADAIFPEALTTADMFRAVAQRLPGIPLLANMTEFG